jgi:hypothetical protein
MASELLIRPGREDHVILGELLDKSGPVPGRRPIPMSRVVVDAHHVAHRPEYAELAQQAGLPYLIDPLTYLWQSPVRADHEWARLPFGQSAPVSATSLADPFERERLAISAADFQLHNGASAIIPAYPYVADVSDPWFEVALNLVELTGSYLEHQGVGVPLVPVLCFKLQSFSTPEGLALGIDRFVEVCKKYDIAVASLCPSPAGTSRDSADKVRRLFRVSQRASEQLSRVVAWRQGGLGPALVAAGLAGYETGLGTGEQMDVPSRQTQFKPKRPRSGSGDDGGGGNDFVYLQLLQRSVRKRVAAILLNDAALGPKLMCDDPNCCSSRTATLKSNRRQHVVRSRHRQLEELDRLPQREWKLHQVSMEAERASTLATQANRLLAANPPTAGKLKSHPMVGTGAYDAVTVLARELAGLS